MKKRLPTITGMTTTMTEFIAPGQIDEIIESVTLHGTGWILAVVVFSMFVENIFPPYPGDAVIFAAGFISGSGKLSVYPVILLSIVASLSSIMLAYWIGRRYGRSVLENRKLRFLGKVDIPKLEGWLGRYGVGILIVSRFLAGARAMITVLAGVGGVSPARMAFYSGVSVVIWNNLVILSAYYLNRNWEAVYDVLSTYNTIVFTLVVFAAAVYVTTRIVKARQRS